MRVLQIGPYPPPHGGVQTNLVDIRNYLRKQGCSCEAINITRHRRADADGVYYPSNALELARLLLRLRYDVVHLHIGGHLSGRLLALSLVCCLMPGSKAVLSFHSGGYPSSPAGKTAGPRTLRGWVMRRFDGVIAVNREIADLFGRFGVSAARVRLIPPHSVSPPEEETARVRAGALLRRAPAASDHRGPARAGIRSAHANRCDGECAGAPSERRPRDSGLRQPGRHAGGADCEQALPRSDSAVWRRGSRRRATRDCPERCRPAHHVVRWRFGRRARSAGFGDTGNRYRQRNAASGRPPHSGARPGEAVGSD